MRIKALEIAGACAIVVIAILGYIHISDIIVGVYLEERWAVIAAGELSGSAVRPYIIGIAIAVLITLTFGIIRTLTSREFEESVSHFLLRLWKLATRLPIPDKLTLSPITRFAERILTSDYKLQRNGLKYVPDNTKVLLDVGCGGAVYLDNINAYKIGVDVNPKRLTIARDHCIAIERDIVSRGISDLEADAVVCFEVIEHLSDEEGTKLLKELENYPFVVLSTPREFFNVNRNGAERHRSFWNAEKLKSFGYEKVEECIVPPSNIYVRKRK